jgi:hypothetical protein
MRIGFKIKPCSNEWKSDKDPYLFGRRRRILMKLILSVTESDNAVRIMTQKTLLEEGKIEETVRAVANDSFTVLDFVAVFREKYPVDWKNLVNRFGQFGSKRRYTVTTYFSNRLDMYSQKPDSLLEPFTRYKQAKFKDYGRTTPKERKVFGSFWIAVFRKKKRRT